MSREKVGMLMMHLGTPRDREAREELMAALPPGSFVGAPDDVGVFEVEIDAPDRESALRLVWDSVAASGTDDHLLFLEHSDLPGHWRRHAGRPS